MKKNYDQDIKYHKIINKNEPNIPNEAFNNILMILNKFDDINGAIENIINSPDSDNNIKIVELIYIIPNKK